MQGVLVAGLYLPNGNPIKGPKFKYKLAWFESLIAHARRLYEDRRRSCWPATSTSFRPTSTSTTRSRGHATRCCSRRAASATGGSSRRAGWIRCRRVHGDERIYTFWDYFREHWKRDSGLRIDHLLLDKALAPRLADAGVDRWVRDRPKASDHAPTWIVLSDKSQKARRKVRSRHG